VRRWCACESFRPLCPRFPASAAFVVAQNEKEIVRHAQVDFGNVALENSPIDDEMFEYVELFGPAFFGEDPR